MTTNLNQIAKELEQKARQLNKKEVFQVLKIIPDFYPSLIQHTNLQILKDEQTRLLDKVIDWKWPSLTDKLFNKEILVSYTKGNRTSKPKTIVDDLCAFAELLRSFASRKGMPLTEANLKLRPILNKNPYITAKAAAAKVGCSESTIVNTDAWKQVKEGLKKGRKPKAQRLTDTRLKITPVEDAELQKLIDEQEKDSHQRKIHPSI